MDDCDGAPYPSCDVYAGSHCADRASRDARRYGDHCGADPTSSADCHQRAADYNAYSSKACLYGNRTAPDYNAYSGKACLYGNRTAAARHGASFIDAVAFSNTPDIFVDSASAITNTQSCRHRYSHPFYHDASASCASHANDEADYCAPDGYTVTSSCRISTRDWLPRFATCNPACHGDTSGHDNTEAASDGDDTSGYGNAEADGDVYPSADVYAPASDVYGDTSGYGNAEADGDVYPSADVYAPASDVYGDTSGYGNAEADGDVYPSADVYASTPPHLFCSACGE